VLIFSFWCIVVNCLEIVAGVIDQDYRGNVGVVLFNFGKQDFKGMLLYVMHLELELEI